MFNKDEWKVFHEKGAIAFIGLETLKLMGWFMVQNIILFLMLKVPAKYLIISIATVIVFAIIRSITWYRNEKKYIQ